MKKTSIRILALAIAPLLLGTMGNGPLWAAPDASSASTIITPKPITVIAHAPVHPQHMDTQKQLRLPTFPDTSTPFPAQGNPRATARAEYQNSAAYHDGPWSPVAQLSY